MSILSSQDSWGVLGKKIGALMVDDNALLIRLEGGPTLRLWDDGQCCCESRYMSTDDDLPYFHDAKLIGFELREALEGSIDENGEYHEIQFLVVHTDKGDIVLSNHNEHNGYYGGFDLLAAIDGKEVDRVYS